MLDRSSGMALDLKTRKRLFMRCDPTEAVRPFDDRNVDLDALDLSETPVRGLRWVDTLAHRIELSDRPVCELLTAVPGAGVTTELLRLSQRLGAAEGARLLVVYINAAAVVDLSSPIDASDLLIAILEATELAVVSAGDATSRGHVHRLYRWLQPNERGPESVLGTLGVTLRHSPAARAKLHAAVDVVASRFYTEVLTSLIMLDAGARRRGYRGVVVLLDGMEKLRGLSTNWREVLASAAQTFRNEALLRLPVHAVLTLPPALLFELESAPQGVHLLPMVRLHHRDGATCTSGQKAARWLVFRRIPPDTLRTILGPDDFEARMERLILWSGGQPREIVRGLRELVGAATRVPLSANAFERTLQASAELYRMALPEQALTLLARVALTRELRSEHLDDVHLLEPLLSSGAVLPYRDDVVWFDVNPAVKETSAFDAAMARVHSGLW